MSKEDKPDRGGDNVVELPDDFIGKDDEARLESFGAYLISHGAASRWRWERRGGIDVAFEVYGGRQRELMFAIRRDRENDLFYVIDASGERVDSGRLEQVMTVADSMARALHGDSPA